MDDKRKLTMLEQQTNSRTESFDASTPKSKPSIVQSTETSLMQMQDAIVQCDDKVDEKNEEKIRFLLAENKECKKLLLEVERKLKSRIEKPTKSV